jgi:gamma-glutamyl:cysteine ligase YbdK (ATP-grasp superfamily)
MRKPLQRTSKAIATFLAALLLAALTAAPAPAQEKKVGQTNGVDNSKMGAYRALAQHIYSDFQKGDVAAAAEMGRVLERLWDKAEDYGGDAALSKTNKQLFDEIDKAMDAFLTPIWEAKAKPPDPAKVKAAFNTYLEKLRLAD